MNLNNWWKRLSESKAARRANSCLRIEELEVRCVLSVTDFRPIDEVGNNQADTDLGTAGIDQLRNSDPAYANGFSTPSMGGPWFALA